jgi:hypothetical protein
MKSIYFYLVAVLCCYAIHVSTSTSVEVVEEILSPKEQEVKVTTPVYAGRSEESPEGGEGVYDKNGLPNHRKWLTHREWRGRHIKGDTLKRFKKWKVVHIESFIKFLGKEIQKECTVFPDLVPSVIIAQAITESNFGLSRLAVTGNNLFGHKYRGQKEGFLVAADDSPTDKFTKFKSQWFSIRSHSYLLNGKYKKRIKDTQFEMTDWLYALCGGLTVKRSKKWVKEGGTVYATSCMTPICYAEKLRRVIKFYKLEKFDK